MSEKATVSFVIPCHNDGRFVRDAIASVEKCPSGLFELIIVDDGSTDNLTPQIMSELQNEGYHIIRQENKGPAAARNTGIRAASAEYILPLDSDNRIKSEFVEKAVEILDTKPEIGIVHSDFQYFGLADHLCRIEPFDIAKMLYSNYIDTCALYRKAMWTGCGGYDEHPALFGLEDWEFWLHAYSLDWKFVHLDMVGFDYAYRENSQLQKTKLEENWKEAEKYLYSKYVMLLKEHYRDYHRWDYHGSALRRRPFRTLFRLFTNAFLPKLHKRLYRIS